ncbi:MAG TPA: AlkA N-terminal domain-containing protein [Acidimicrobiales bacterium]|nr:AlkA N-terminal domain-containing protein [Acidimicrobiales bacterium]
MLEDFDRCYRAVQSRDARFDGWFVTAVTSTRIYCRPSCPARTPHPEHVRFYSAPAAAQAAGFRACLRCRPDAAPGSPEWNTRADAAGRAMRLIADGVVDREGVVGLARRLGYSERQLHRVLVAEVGTGALAIARAQRAQSARLLLETTELPVAHVAFAAGFSSVRQFNDTVRAVFGRPPSELRRRHRRPSGPGEAPGPGAVALRLAHRAPFASAELFAFLAARAVPGIEAAVDGRYRRSVRLAHGDGVVELWPSAGYVAAQVWLDDLRDLGSAVSRCRRLLDLDADPVAVDEVLGADTLLRPFVRATPGRRVPGSVDGAELAVRAVIGQQISIPGAATVAGRLVAAAGRPLRHPQGPVTHTFPGPAELVDVDPAALPMPASRRAAVTTLAGALAAGDLVIDPGADRAELEQRLLALPGVGPWTASYVVLRALSDPDAFLPSDLGVRRGLARLGQPDDPASVTARAERWRPFRAYAVGHLWAAAARALPNASAPRGARPTKKASVAA